MSAPVEVQWSDHLVVWHLAARCCGPECAGVVVRSMDATDTQVVDPTTADPFWCEACGVYVPGVVARDLGDVSTPADSLGWYVANGDSILAGPLPDLLDAIDAPRSANAWLDLARVLVSPEPRTYLDTDAFVEVHGQTEPMARMVAGIIEGADGYADARAVLERALRCLLRAYSFLPHLGD